MKSSTFRDTRLRLAYLDTREDTIYTKSLILIIKYTRKLVF